MNNKNFTVGTYPTMITPYDSDGHIDYDAVDRLVEWYWKKGCDGIFAVCQSSEVFYLTLNERVNLAKRVKVKSDQLASSDKSRQPMTIVASGHISDSIPDQTYELKQMADTGVDAIILISNRLGEKNTGDDEWILNAEKLLKGLNEDIPLGIYECPKPYKRLLTPKILNWCSDTGRFRFIKDTCCDGLLIKERLCLLEKTDIYLFNANAQTLLETLRYGAAGYCGVMANFHPELYVKLCRDFNKNPEQSELLQSFLCIAAFTESLAYPVTAKYHLSFLENIKMEVICRSRDTNELTDYQKSCIKQLKQAADYFAAIFC